MKPSKIVFILLFIPVLILDVAIFLKVRFQLESVITMLVTFVLIVGGYYFFVLRRGGEKLEKDERTIKLNSRASTYAFLMSFYVVILLMGCDTLGLLRLTGAQALTIVMTVMSWSYLILTFLISRKGDVV